MEFEKYDGFKLYKDVALVDLPCYSCPPVQADFRKKIRKMSFVIELSNEDMNIMKILVPLTENPNAPDKLGYTPIHIAAFWGNKDFVKTLAHLTENPNAPNSGDCTPIYGAAQNGHTEIVKILAPLTDNPNAPNNSGCTPINKWLISWMDLLMVQLCV